MLDFAAARQEVEETRSPARVEVADNERKARAPRLGFPWLQPKRKWVASFYADIRAHEDVPDYLTAPDRWNSRLDLLLGQETQYP
jgi:hypothetical protein